MGFQPPERKNYVSIIPDDLRMFEEGDIPAAFDYLERHFHLNKQWRAEFKKQLMTIQRSIPVQEFFFQFATQNIDPALQRILRRKDSVIFAMCRYLIRDRIREKKQVSQSLRNYGGRSGK